MYDARSEEPMAQHYWFDSTFWGITLLTAPVMIVITGLDKLISVVISGKTHPLFLSVVAIIIAMAAGFDAVVEAIKGRK